MKMQLKQRSSRVSYIYFLLGKREMKKVNEIKPTFATIELGRSVKLTCTQKHELLVIITNQSCL